MRTPSFIIFLIVVVIVAAFIGALAYFTYAPRQNFASQNLDGQASQKEVVSPTRPVVGRDDPIRGDHNAPLAILEFGDFFCPACADVEPVLASVLSQYKGKVKLVWKDFPNTARHPLAQRASEAARCAGEQGRFWEYHDRLLEQTDQGQSLTEEGLSLVAREFNLDAAKFEECLTSGRMQEVVRRTFNEGLLLRLDGTPYFFVGSQRFSGAVSEDELKEAIERNL